MAIPFLGSRIGEQIRAEVEGGSLAIEVAEPPKYTHGRVGNSISTHESMRSLTNCNSAMSSFGLDQTWMDNQVFDDADDVGTYTIVSVSSL